MKKPLIAAIAFLALAPFGVRASDNSAVPYAQGWAAYNALLVPTTPPTPATADTYAARATALQTVIAAPDITAEQKASAYIQLGHAQRLGKLAPAVYLDSYNQGYLLGNPEAFLDWFGFSLDAGEPYATPAKSAVPAFASAFPVAKYGGWATARTAEANKQYDEAFTLWKGVADSYNATTMARSYAVAKAGQMSRARGDAPVQTNQFLIQYLTAYNVGFADSSFQVAYDLINRSPTVQPADATRAFLTSLLTIVDVTDTNAKFLGKVQSQLNALPTPVPTTK